MAAVGLTLCVSRDKFLSTLLFLKHGEADAGPGGDGERRTGTIGQCCSVGRRPARPAASWLAGVFHDNGARGRGVVLERVVRRLPVRVQEMQYALSDGH